MSTRTTPTAASALPAAIKSTRIGRGWRRLVAVLLTLSVVITGCYAAVSIYFATQLVYVPQLPLPATPASFALQYKNVTFPSLDDHHHLQGWFIPGALPNGGLTGERTIILVHGNQANRAGGKGTDLLKLSVAFARHGFAVLAFDVRGNGESPPAPRSFGYFEQRDVLGAVDFLRTGSLPYPELGRAHAIAGWGLSMGGSALILAAAREPAIRAIVADCTAADYLPILQRELPKASHLPPLFTPGALLSARALYGMDYSAVRPVDVVAQLAPRPLFFIHGGADHFIPPSNMSVLAAAAHTAPNAHVQTWLVPGAGHSQSYHTQPQAYVNRVIAFYTAALGPDTGAQ